MDHDIPKQIVHYNRAKPFRSISAIPNSERRTAIESLTETNSWGLGRFKDPNYMSQRLEVESRMRDEFIRRGGTPTLSHPIYFFLGRNIRFEEHPLNIAYAIEISLLDRKQISFSYGDTMLSFDEVNRKLSGDRYSHPLCGRLFMLEELDDLMKDDVFATPSPLAIEAHLWICPEDRLVTRLDR